MLEDFASRPRFAGSETEAEARTLCRAWLETRKFSVSEQWFTFSEFPGRYGPPFVSLLLISVALISGQVYSWGGGAEPAIVFLLLGSATSVALGVWLAKRGIFHLPWYRNVSVNLIARRGNPAVWLVAHIDSKSQTIPMLARVASVVATTVGFVGLTLSLVADWITTIPGGGGVGAGVAVPIWTMVTVIAAVPMAVCLTRNKSPGAVDNASGLIAVLLAARGLPPSRELGVIVTSAEELGLAGARAYLASRPERAIALNCDTIDDRGGFLCMPGNPGGIASQAVARAATALGFPLRVRRLIPGILADSIAFADSGWDSLTISRGNIATLARVHTSSDTRDRLDGSGIAQAALLLAATIEELS